MEINNVPKETASDIATSFRACDSRAAEELNRLG